jgi:hypothetical protein
MWNLWQIFFHHVSACLINNVMDTWRALLLLRREVPASNLGPLTGFPERCVSLITRDKFRDSATTVSFHIFCKKLFTNHPIIRHHITRKNESAVTWATNEWIMVSEVRPRQMDILVCEQASLRIFLQCNMQQWLHKIPLEGASGWIWLAVTPLSRKSYGHYFCSLFTDAFSNAECTGSSGAVASEITNWKLYARKSWISLAYYLGIRLKRLRKPIKPQSAQSQSRPQFEPDTFRTQVRSGKRCGYVMAVLRWRDEWC